MRVKFGSRGRKEERGQREREFDRERRVEAEIRGMIAHVCSHSVLSV
jgi:hypothetical protein